VILGALLLTGCQLPSFGAYRGSTSQAQSTFKLWQGFFLAGLVVGGVVLLLILWAVIRYRRRSEEIPRQTQYHTLTEVIYTVTPILTVIGLFVATVVVENQVTAVSPNPYTTIHVYAFQWGWEFQYDNGVKIIGQTTDNGVYRGQCTQLCGLYHSLMFFNVRSVSAPAYQSWLRAEGTFQRNHPNSIGQLPAGVHPNVNGSVPSYSGNSSNTGNTGGAYYGD